MTYRIREGIELVLIQDVYLIVSSAPCWKECSYITQTNEMGAFIWRQLIFHKGINEITKLISEEYETEDIELVIRDVNQFIKSMIQSNYLIEERNDTE